MPDPSPDTPSVCPFCEIVAGRAPATIVQSSRCPWLGLGYEEPGCGTCEFCRIRDALEADDAEMLTEEADDGA